MISKIIKLVVLFLAFMLIGGLCAYLTLTFIVKSTGTVVVPDLREKDVVQALELLTHLGLNTKIKGSEFHSTLPKNRIIHQDPEPGAEIKTGRDVRVILSKGPQTLIMPDLEGLTIEEAKAFLEKWGLCTGTVSHTTHDAVAKDQILAHTPTEGKEIIRDTCVNLLVSDGQRPVAYMMPELVGKSPAEALLTLEKYGLILGDIIRSREKRKKENTVLAQTPLAGVRVEAGSRVDLRVNAGPETIISPDTAGIIRHRLAPGFLNSHIRVSFKGYGMQGDLIDDYYPPGSEITLLIPKTGRTEISLYKDGKLIVQEIF